MAEITLWPKTTASRIILDQAFKIAGHKVGLFKGALEAFIFRTYDEGYVLGRTDSEAFAKLQKSSALTIRVGAVEIFLPGYGKKFIFAQAESNSKLPMALIKHDLEKMIDTMFADGYCFGKAINDASRDKLKMFSDKNLTVQLVMKEPENAPPKSEENPASTSPPCNPEMISQTVEPPLAPQPAAEKSAWPS